MDTFLVNPASRTSRLIHPHLSQNTQQLNKQGWKTAQARLAKLEREQEKKRREANSILGIFSTYGVDETKSLFWKVNVGLVGVGPSLWLGLGGVSV